MTTRNETRNQVIYRSSEIFLVMTGIMLLIVFLVSCKRIPPDNKQTEITEYENTPVAPVKPTTDSTPDSFGFQTVNDSEPDIPNVFTFQVTGINTYTDISISGDKSAEFSINGADFRSDSAQVKNYDLIKVRVVSSSAFSSTVSATLDIGGIIGTFSVTNKSFSSMSSDQQNSLIKIKRDSTEPHVGLPHGVPSSWDWATSPVIKNIKPSVKYQDCTAWGQFFIEKYFCLIPSNTRIQVRRVRFFYLDKNHTWHGLQKNSQIDGRLFHEDFSDGTLDIDTTYSDGTDGISATVQPGYCFHFWPRNRGTLPDPENVIGIFATFEARLIVKDSSMPDDRDTAHILASAGADFYKTSENPDKPSMDSIPSGTGRFRYVRTGWDSYNFSTVPTDLLENYPPPF